MGKKRVFVSFDYDYDARQKDLLVGQSKNSDSPFELSDWSIKEAISSNWQDKARVRIRSVDLVIVLCGLHTNKANGVSAELKIAQEENIKYFLLAAYSHENCIKPTAAKITDKIYQWNWPNLKKLVAGNR